MARNRTPRTELEAACDLDWQALLQVVGGPDPNALPAEHVMGMAIFLMACAAYFTVGLLGISFVKLIMACAPERVHLFNAVSGGILIGLAVVHMLAENAAETDSWGQAIGQALGGRGAFPVGFVLAGLGFFLVLALGRLLGHPCEHWDSDAEALREGGGPRIPAAAASSPSRCGEGGPGDGPGSALYGSSSAADDQGGKALPGIATWAGISLHSFIEAVAAGSVRSDQVFGMLVSATLLHKGFEGFAVASSLECFGSNSLMLRWFLQAAFLLAGPLGLITGAVFSAGSGQGGAAALQCLASGTLLAVGIDHMLLPALECGSADGRSLRLFAAVVAFLAVSILAVWN